ncbi:hypothetical protein DL93DRAFT_1290491 [Clavulina sp. PMI_390]|nr:hypothetical protein DL93DRAFT_1290491 [Clavulina sp. PMI_390]
MDIDIIDVSATNDELASLQEKLNLLNDLSRDLQNVRQLPKSLLQPHSGEARITLSRLEEFSTSLASPGVSSALDVASSREREDGTDVEDYRRLLTKPNPAAASRITPSPSFTPSRRGPQFLPPIHHPLQTQKTTLGTLPDFIRWHNRTNSPGATTLRIWVPAAAPKPANARASRKSLRVGASFVLRLVVPNVMHVAIRMGSAVKEDEPLRIMTVTCVGVNESKPRHAASEFAVYRMVTQHLARVLSERPDVSLAQFIDLLASYGNLFSQTCSVCGALLSRVGRHPPVARLWSADGLDTSGGRWQSRHVECCYVR